MNKCIHDLLRKSVKNERMFIIEKLAVMDKPTKACSCGKNNEKYNNLTYALYMACCVCNLNVAKKIFEINKKILAIYGDQAKTKKAKTNRYDIHINAVFSYNKGHGCIHEAALRSIDLVKLLLQNGADINLKNDNGNNPLMRSMQYGDVSDDIIKFLIENTTNLDSKNNDGETSLMTAIKHEVSDDIIKVLVENTTNLDLKNNDGNTALHIAIQKKISQQLNF